MKKRLISLTAILLCFLNFGLVSCEGEDEGGDYVTPNYLAGTWKLSEIGSLNSNSTLIYTPVAEGSCDTQTFNFADDFTYTRSYSMLTNDVCAPQATTGTYAFNQGNLEVKYAMDGQPDPVKITYDIITLSDVMLEIAFTNPSTNNLVFWKFTKMVPIVIE